LNGRKNVYWYSLGKNDTYITLSTYITSYWNNATLSTFMEVERGSELRRGGMELDGLRPPRGSDMSREVHERLNK